MFNRLTGIMMSGPLYLFSMAYVAAPLLGWQLSSAALAASFAKWPVIAQLGAKLFAAFPFVFHSLNGLRHLTWDTGASLTNAQVSRTGWTVVGLTVAGSLGLAFFV